MLSFGSDNHSGVHPKIMKALQNANEGHAPSYGSDDFTRATIEGLQTHFGKSADISFVFNGTAANVLCLHSLIDSHESILCADTAHLNLDECGAPEKAIGSKVISVKSQNGKIYPEDVLPYLIRHGDQHYAQPKIVSLTTPTEYGTVYSYQELADWRNFTKKHNLKLHIDGARFIYMPQATGKSFLELTEQLEIDALSFGGTKNGLLFGEAVVLYDSKAAAKIKYIRKQNMQLPSKMRFLAAQFSELMLTDLWLEIASHSHNMALHLQQKLNDLGIEATQAVDANAVFVKFPQKWIKPLRESAGFFYVWDEFTFECRLMMSFDVTRADIDAFADCVRKLKMNPK